MVATVEVDRIGRLVIPKKIREILHLRPGDKLELECDGERLVMSREQPAVGLHRKAGWLVYDPGGKPFSSEEARQWLDGVRETRLDQLSGLK